jgi:hypothetical protein
MPGMHPTGTIDMAADNQKAPPVIEEPATIRKTSATATSVTVVGIIAVTDRATLLSLPSSLRKPQQQVSPR